MLVWHMDLLHLLSIPMGRVLDEVVVVVAVVEVVAAVVVAQKSRNRHLVLKLKL